MFSLDFPSTFSSPSPPLPRRLMVFVQCKECLSLPLYFSFVFYLFLCHLCITFCNMPSNATFCFPINAICWALAVEPFGRYRIPNVLFRFFFSSSFSELPAIFERIKWHSHELLMAYCISARNEFSYERPLFIDSLEITCPFFRCCRFCRCFCLKF